MPTEEALAQGHTHSDISLRLREAQLAVERCHAEERAAVDERTRAVWDAVDKEHLSYGQIAEAMGFGKGQRWRITKILATPYPEEEEGR